MAISKSIKRMLGGSILGFFAASVVLAPLQAQEIYKTVDENGNVVYTDQKPDDNAVPVNLKELTVVDAIELGDEQAIDGVIEKEGAAESEAETETIPPPGLNILSPAPEETINNTGYVLSVQVDADGELPEGSQLAYLVDGEVRVTTRSLNVELEQIFRGEHRLGVELRGPGGRVLSSAGPVTFFMRQHSIQHPPPG